MTQEQNWLDNALEETVSRLQQLVRVPSFSKEESDVAHLFAGWMKADGITYEQKGQNLWARNVHTDPAKPTVLLNSHLDTVKPNGGYTRDAFDGALDNGRLYGLGSTDAGGALLCLYAVFKQLYARTDLPVNLVFAATAEEEISGANGVAAILDELGTIDLALVGEPTRMHLAIAEKGLLVLDAVAYGKAGHAAREEGENAIYKAMQDIAWFQSHQFPVVSPTLGPVKMNVTWIEAGTQHNVIPAECRFTVDIRTTDAYSHEALIALIREQVSSQITPRSLRLRPSSVSLQHPVVRAAIKLGREPFASPTLSDQALMPFPSVKIGPGDSARSHQADEYILTEELEEGLRIYHQLLTEHIA